MQIHELTAKPQLDEGLLDLAKKTGQKIAQWDDTRSKAGAQAAQSAAALQAQGYGAGYQGAPATWQSKMQAVAAPATQQYVKSVSQAWLKQSKTVPQATATPTVAPKTKPTAAATTTKISAPPSPGAPTPAEQARLQQRIDAALGQSGLTEAVDATAYKTAFLAFAEQQLRTRDSVTGHTITLDTVRQQFPDLAQRLDLILDQMIQRAGTPEETAAVENFFSHATAGVQAAAQADRNRTAQRGAGTVSGQASRMNATVEQTAELNRLAQQLGGIDNLIKAARAGAGRP